jgi:hypothetical protein
MMVWFSLLVVSVMTCHDDGMCYGNGNGECEGIESGFNFHFMGLFVCLFV